MKATISQAGEHFEIKLDTPLDKIYGGSVYLSIFKPKISAGGSLLMVDISENPLSRYQKLVDILERKMGFELDIDSSAKGTLRAAERDRQNFLEFSEKARRIRNDNGITEDFAAFKDSLASLQIQLKLFQLLAAYHLSFSQNACNFSVPGAGKTITVYGAYNYLKALPPENHRNIDRLVVVGPLSAFTR